MKKLNSQVFVRKDAGGALDNAWVGVSGDGATPVNLSKYTDMAGKTDWKDDITANSSPTRLDIKGVKFGYARVRVGVNVNEVQVGTDFEYRWSPITLFLS